MFSLGIALMMLVDEGKVDLNSTIDKYLDSDLQVSIVIGWFLKKYKC
jgi:CubicO group peptidase (beta-lactamase class C family)